MEEKDKKPEKEERKPSKNRWMLPITMGVIICVSLLAVAFGGPIGLIFPNEEGCRLTIRVFSNDSQVAGKMITLPSNVNVCENLEQTCLDLGCRYTNQTGIENLNSLCLCEFNKKETISGV